MHSFLSPQTFLNWWFSWAILQRRKLNQPCPQCKYKPTKLVGDGTKIGIALRNLNMQAFETTGNDEVLETKLRRNDRSFLAYGITASQSLKENVTKTRIQIKEFCNFLLDRKPSCNPGTNVAIIQEIVNILPETTIEAFTRMCTTADPREKVVLAKVFSILASTASLTSLLPPRYLPHFKFILEYVTLGTQTLAGD